MAVAGLITRSASGKVLLDTTKHVGRFIGIQNTTKNNGYIQHASFSQGTPIWVILGAANSLWQYQPAITLTTINGLPAIQWTWPLPGENANNDFNILYGVK